MCKYVMTTQLVGRIEYDFIYVAKYSNSSVDRLEYDFTYDAKYSSYLKPTAQVCGQDNV